MCLRSYTVLYKLFYCLYGYYSSVLLLCMCIDEVSLSAESDSSSEEYEDQKQYDRRQHKAARAWKKIRGELLHGAVASFSIPPKAICMMCQSENATVLCKQCGSRGYFCEPCAISFHANINILHAPVIQKVCTLCMSTINIYIVIVCQPTSLKL